MSDLPAIPAALTSTLRAWSRRRRVIRAGRILGWSLAVAGALAAAAMSLDLIGDPLPWCRVGLAATTHLTALIGLVMAGLHWRSRPTVHAEALALERAAGLSGEPLSGSLALAVAPPPGTSRWMLERTLALGAVTAHALDLRRLAPWQPLRPAAISALCVALALVAATFADPAARAAAARAALPWRELPAPGDELLVAEPGDTWLAPGSSIDISARITSVPLQAELAWSDGRSELRNLQRDGDLNHLTVGPLHGELRWRVRGPGLASAWRNARLVEVPRIVAVAMQIAPPAYSGLPEERVQGGDASVIAGTNVTVEVVLDTAQTVTAVLVAGDRELPLPLARSPYGGHFGSAHLRVAETVSWRLRLIVPGGSGGVAVDPPQRWLLKCQPDEAPSTAAIAEPTIVAPGRAVRVTVRSQDDVALAAMWLESAHARTPLRLALPVPSGSRQAEASATIVPLDLGCSSGDRMVLVPVARDRAGAETRGEPVEVLVAQPVHAARHDLATRLARLSAAADLAAEAAGDAERAWRAAARSWRPEDPTAGAPGLRTAAARARALASAATEVADGAEAAGVLAGTPGNLDQIATRALTLAGGALALAARSAAAETGSAEAVENAVDAVRVLAKNAGVLAASTALAAGAMEAEAAAADAEAASSALSGAEAVLSAEWAWIRPTWRNGLDARFWRGDQPGTGAVQYHTAEIPAVDNRDIPGLGRDGWCARWLGEILLPHAGRWTFRCTADDGVRLRVAGHDILPNDAWRTQGATPYEGALDLPAGWQPLSLDFFQGGGDSRLLFEAFIDKPTAIPLERLRHRAAPDRATLQAMATLPTGAATAAVERARDAGERLLVAAETARTALAQAARGPRNVAAANGHLKRATRAADQLRATIDWSDITAVTAAAGSASALADATQDLAKILREACRGDARGGSGGGMAERLREAAAKPGEGDARRLSVDLVAERGRLAALTANNLADPAQRCAALAAAWAIDDVTASLHGSDPDAARAAAAAVLPPLALVARHARAAEAAAASALKGEAAAGALLTELALSPGWPPRLLRSARDRLRSAAAALRAGDDPGDAARLAGECAWAAELEAMRPGAPAGADLAAAATVLRDLALLPQPDGLAEIADLFERTDQHMPESQLPAAGLAVAQAARRSAAMAALADSATALHAAIPALEKAGLNDIAARAATLAELARTVSAAPDATAARGLAETLASSVAAPLAACLADGRLEAGEPAAQAGRIAAQAAAEAQDLAAVAALPDTAPEMPEQGAWARATDSSAQGTAAAVIDFPEEQRAAIRAYLRRVGGER